jgi:hypothetical protein
MTRYQNGRAPLSELVQFDTGAGKHWGPAATRARWYQARSRIKARTGVTLHITAGWNVYRPYAEQVIGRANACNQGNCNTAAVPGYSSHGLTWRSARFTGGKWVDAAAIDVGDYWRVPWSIYKAEMEAAGFLVDGSTDDIAGIREPWHIIDLAPYAMPAYENSDEFVPAVKNGALPMFTLVSIPDTGIIWIQGIDGRREGTQSQAHLDALLLFRDAMFQTGKTINSIYFGDFVGQRGAIDWYIGQVNGPRDAATLAKLEELRQEIAKIDPEFDGNPHIFTPEELAAIGAGAVAAVDASVDEILTSLRTLPADVVEELKTRL